MSGIRATKPASLGPARWLTHLMHRRFENAGMTYNTGDWIAIFGAAGQVIITSQGDMAAAAKGLADYFVGSGPALAVSLGSLIFFVGGSRYDQAWANGFPPDIGKNNQGHFWSAIGAALLAAGLVGLSQSSLALGAALVGGFLQIGGKAGSLIDPRRDAFYKYLPLVSRAPAIVSLLADIDANVTSADATHSILPALLIGCNLIWARADTMLMPECMARRALSRMLLAERAP